MTRIKISKDLIFILVVSSAVIPGIMSTAMLSLAFSDVAEYFNVSYHTFQWRNVVFFGVFAISILYFGSTVPKLGARRLILSAQTIFVVSTVISSCTSNWEVFLIAQGFQAVADGIMVPSQMSLIRNRVNKERWGWAFGWFHGTLAIAPLIGPIVGACLISKYSWQAMPLLAGLVQALVLMGCLRVLPKDKISEDAFSRPPVTSALLLFVILCFGQLGLGQNDDSEKIFLDLSLIGLTTGVVILLFLEYSLSLKGRISLVPWESLKNIKFALALFRIFCVFLVSNAAALHLPSALLAISDISIGTLGAILSGAALLNILFEPILGRFADKWGYLSLNCGLAVMVIAAALYLAIPSVQPTTIFLSATILTVFAAALFSPAQLRDASMSIGEADRDRFMGFYMFCQFVSGAFAATIFGAVLQDGQTGHITLVSFHEYATLSVVLLSVALFSGAASAIADNKYFRKLRPSDLNS